MKRILLLPLLFVLGLFGSGCATRSPIRTVPEVDLDRFMGDWFVIGGILTPLEKGAFNPLESYAMNEDGTVATTFRFNKGGFDGPEKVFHPKGFIRDDSNAIWGMQFIWPIKADYRIVFLDDAYSQTVIGRNRRDFAWIMARTPELPAGDFERIVELLVEEGYDRSKIRVAPQSERRRIR